MFVDSSAASAPSLHPQKTAYTLSLSEVKFR